MKQLFIITASIFLISCSTTNNNSSLKITECTNAPDADHPIKLWETRGLSAPESVVFNPADNHFYVSNIVGAPTDKDAKGWISKISKSGKMVSKKWATGKRAISKDLRVSLNAPKGMKIKNNTLWVSDIDEVTSIQLNTGKVSGRISIPGAKFLNDIAFSKTDSKLFVSDMFTNKIHAIQKSPNRSTFIETRELENPNGLTTTANNEVLVASWGPGIKNDFSTEKSGRILSINQKTKKISKWNNIRIGNLDGIEFIDENTVVVSDWKAGKIYKVKKNGSCTAILSGFKGSADLTYLPKEKLLVIPLMLENKIVAFKLK
jgi:DNA-binding beta-propeller fold protein YncE